MFVFVLLLLLGPQHSSCHVYSEGNDVYDCMLNQTNIGNNNNKYYIIQLLQSDAGNNYWVNIQTAQLDRKSKIAYCLFIVKVVICRENNDICTCIYIFLVRFGIVGAEWEKQLVRR